MESMGTIRKKLGAYMDADKQLGKIVARIKASNALPDSLYDEAIGLDFICTALKADLDKALDIKPGADDDEDVYLDEDEDVYL